MKQKREEKLLRLWKMRQEAEGHDVSGVNTLQEAEHFFDTPRTSAVDEPPKKPQKSAKRGAGTK